MISQLKNRIGSLSVPKAFKKIARNENGSIITEFALVLPFFISMLLGFGVFAKGQQMSTFNGKSASVVADLIAQSEKLTKEEIDAIMIAGEAVAGVTEGAKIKIGVFGVDITEDGTTKVIWARGVNGAPLPTVGSSYAIPEYLTLEGEANFLIISETSTTYTPAIAQNLLGSYHITAKNVFAPRIGDNMRCTDCNN